MVPDISMKELESILPNIPDDFLRDSSPKIEEYNIGTKDFLEKSVLLSIFTGIDNYKHLSARPMPWIPSTVRIEGGNRVIDKVQRMESVKTASSFYKKVDFGLDDVGVSAGGVGLGLTFKYKNIKDYKANVDSILIDMHTRFSPVTLNPFVKLNDGAKTLLQKGHVEAFLERYGYLYVKGYSL
eukprot:Pgem_evm1s7263